MSSSISQICSRLSSPTAWLFFSLVLATGGVGQESSPAPAEISHQQPGASDQAPASAASDAPAPQAELTDATIEAYQGELLEVAFRAATAFPVMPHIKNRSRTQESVVATCLELDLPLRALGYIGAIDNWRRAAALADVALYCARKDRPEQVEEFLAQALEVAKDPDPELDGWRRDRIRAKIAQTYYELGRFEEAQLVVRGLETSEVGPVAQARARQATKADFDAQLAATDAIVVRADFEQVRAAIGALVELYGAHYSDEARRERAEVKIKASWGKLPIQIRLDTLMHLGEAALEHQDSGRALRLAGEVHALLMAHEWLPEEEMQAAARLASLRALAGDVRAARADAEMAMGLFEGKRAKIVDIYRAGAVRPLAEAYADMGERERALELYALALDEGMANPNSRPRATDLVATCCSMARKRVRPSESLMLRIKEISDSLGGPW